MRRWPWVLALAPIVSCGGRLPAEPSDGGDAGGDGAWTTCRAPSGVQVCGGPNRCPAGGDCFPCSNVLWDAGSDVLGTCRAGWDGSRFCSSAADGEVCVQQYVGEWFSAAPFDLGTLFLQNGAADRARYADYSLFTGDPLPAPTVCPKLSFGQVCGGNCGACANGLFCHGRSPRHPYGVCLPMRSLCKRGEVPCPEPGVCFVFEVEPEAQANADAVGVCMRQEMCAEYAALPGGAFCTP